MSRRKDKKGFSLRSVWVLPRTERLCHVGGAGALKLALAGLLRWGVIDDGDWETAVKDLQVPLDVLGGPTVVHLEQDASNDDEWPIAAG